MTRAAEAQLHIRSAFARARAHELAKRTGMTVTEIIEDALRVYVPPGAPPPADGLARRGPLLILAADGPPISLAEAQAALTASRQRDGED